jgi:hypothetical protein
MVVNGGGRLSSTSPPSATSSPTGRALQTVLGVDSEQPMARSKRRSMCAMRTPDPGYLAGRIRLMVVLAALAASRLLTAGLRTQGAILFESATLTTNGRTHCVSLADSPRWTVAPGATQDLVFVVDLDGLLCDILGESVDIELRYRSREGRSESFGVHYEKLRERSGGRLANEGGWPRLHARAAGDALPAGRACGCLVQHQLHRDDVHVHQHILPSPASGGHGAWRRRRSAAATMFGPGNLVVG